MSAPITLVGRLGADPDLKFGQSGKAVVRLRVVTNSRRQVDGQWKDVDATWWSVVAFGPLAEQATENLSKGSAVIVVGKAKESEWTDKEGNQRKSIEVMADSLGPDLRWASGGITREKPTTFDDDPWAISDPAKAPF
jgi:single-strand DNA-binding protein